jgi:hypothetical protein
MGNVWDIKGRYKEKMNVGSRGDRAIFGGGGTPSIVNIIEYVNISSTGDATDFGDLTVSRRLGGSAATNTRVVWPGGLASPGSTAGATNTIDYVVSSSLGNAADWGDLAVGRGYSSGGSNQIRAISLGGSQAPSPYYTNVIDYFTLTSLGNAADFGNLTASITDMHGPTSPTRATVAGGFSGTADAVVKNIDYIEIMTTGNAADFGDLSANRHSLAPYGSTTRGIFAGGQTSPAAGNEVNVIEYITIATTSNTTDFGDLLNAKTAVTGSSNNTRGLTAGGYVHPAIVNVIEYATIASTGNGTDFGDLSAARSYMGNGSNGPGHGGLEAELPQRASVNYMPGSGRAFTGGGMVPGVSTVVSYFHIPTLGNAVDFGDLPTTRGALGGTSNTTRSIFGGGYAANDTALNQLETIEHQSQGNASDFGDLTAVRMKIPGTGSATRGMYAGGDGPTPGFAKSDVVDYITLASVGDASDFGNLSAATKDKGAASSGTRAVFSGGATPTKVNVMDYFTIASTGDATDFGNLTAARQEVPGVSSATRACFGGGNTGSDSNIIDYITIASAGDASDFGDLTSSRNLGGAASNKLRGVWFGGHVSDNVNTMDYVTIASTGNAADFGDLLSIGNKHAGTSDSHGGL